MMKQDHEYILNEVKEKWLSIFRESRPLAGKSELLQRAIGLKLITEVEARLTRSERQLSLQHQERANLLCAE